MLGVLPMASSTWLPNSSGAPLAQSTRTPTRSPPGTKLMHSAPVRTRTPSASSSSRKASETSGSSRPMGRGPFSTNITSDPSRRNACANSSPI